MGINRVYFINNLQYIWIYFVYKLYNSFKNSKYKSIKPVYLLLYNKVSKQ